MGGKGSGGPRVGAGRKPKSELEHQVTGDPGHRGRVLTHPGAGSVPAVAPVEEFEAPADLTVKERVVWLELAPFAFSNRTLTKATALAFKLLVRNLVLERTLARRRQTRGGADHRGLIQRVDAEMTAFSLRPTGKPLYAAEPEAGVQTPAQKRSYW